MPLTRQQLHDLARRGAAVRIAELEADIAAIRKEFSGVQPPRRSGKRGRAAVRKRPKMSAAARKVVSGRMKKYWAAKRAAKAKK